MYVARRQSSGLNESRVLVPRGLVAKAPAADSHRQQSDERWCCGCRDLAEILQECVDRRSNHAEAGIQHKTDNAYPESRRTKSVR